MGDQDVTTSSDSGQPQTTPQPGTQPGATPAASGDTISLTNQALTERLKRAERTAVTRLLKDLGLESLDVLKQKLGGTPAPQTPQQPQTTPELDELRQTVEALKAESEQLKAEKQKADAARRDGVVNDALRTAVKSVKYPDDVVAWVRANHQDIAKAMKEDGAIDPAIITGAIEAARKARPEWFAPMTPGSPSNFGGVPPETDQKRKAAALQAQAAHIKKGF